MSCFLFLRDLSLRGNFFRLQDNRISKCFAANIVHDLSTILKNIVNPESGVTMLSSVVDNIE